MNRLLTFDASLSRRLVLPLDSSWRQLARWIAHLGDGPLVFGGLALVYLLAWLWNNPFLRQAMVIVVIVVLSAMIIVTMIKYVVRRQRPQPPGEFVTFKYDAYSFPSGHSARLMALAVGLAFFFPTLSWLVMVIALLVAAARVVVGVHYVSDIVVGLITGAIVAWGTVILLQGFLSIPTP